MESRSLHYDLFNAVAAPYYQVGLVYMELQMDHLVNEDGLDGWLRRLGLFGLDSSIACCNPEREEFHFGSDFGHNIAAFKRLCTYTWIMGLFSSLNLIALTQEPEDGASNTICVKRM